MTRSASRVQPVPETDDQMRERVKAALLAQSDDEAARAEDVDFWFPAIETVVSGFLAALAANGLTITTTERAAIGAAVERLPWQYVIEYDRRDGFVVDAQPEFHGQPRRVGNGPTLPAAIAAALGADACDDDQRKRLAAYKAGMPAALGEDE